MHVCTLYVLTYVYCPTHQVPAEWLNPSGDWHVGVKALYELFPSDLVNRLNVSCTLFLVDTLLLYTVYCLLF